MDFNTRQLRGFQLVAQHGSFSRAAEELFITPSGLSVLIRELEHQLGFRLFDRTTRSVQLTPLGSELLEVSRHSVQELDAVIARLGQTARGVTRSISVGATPLMAANVMPQAIREFRGRRPDVRIQLFDGDLKAILRRVMTGKLEMGLGIFEPVPGVKRTAFFRFSLLFIRAESHGPTAPASMNWAALDGMPLISLAPDNPTQRLIDAALARAGISCPRETVVNLLDTQIALVEANEGAAIIPSFGLPVARRKIVATPLANPTVRLEYHQIHSRANPLSKDTLEFCAFLKGHMSRWALSSA